MQSQFNQRQRSTRSTRTIRRGAMLVLIAIALPVLLIFMGGAVDLAIMQNARTELQVATDLAAKAAASRLSSSGTINQAIAAGRSIARENKVSGKPLTLTQDDFLFGRAERQGNGRWLFTEGAQPFNSVRVTGQRTSQSDNGAVPLPFGSVYGRPSFEPIMTATATFLDIDICFVLDRSSSMKLAVDDTGGLMSRSNPRTCQTPRPDSRWVALEQAMVAFVNSVNQSHGAERVAVVTFSSDNYNPCGETNTEASVDQDLTENLNDVRRAMRSRSNSIWNGMTNIDAGIRAAHDLLTGPSARTHADKVMIVLTDGVYTGSDPEPDAQDANDDHITIHTITFSDGANQSDMQRVASAGQGRHYHAPDAASLEDVFSELAAVVSILTN